MNFTKSKIIILATSLFFSAMSCRDREICKTKKIVDSQLGHIGDSFVCNDLLTKISFIDSLFLVDSIVYRWDNNMIRSVYSYKRGIRVFENIDYYNTGDLASYIFISDKDSNYFYQLDFDPDGNIRSKFGELFFVGLMDKIDYNSLEVEDNGERMHIQIYYPNPPNCETLLYAKIDTLNADVFSQNSYIPFLKEVSVETKMKSKEWRLIDIWLKESCGYDTLLYNQPIHFKVVPKRE